MLTLFHVAYWFLYIPLLAMQSKIAKIKMSFGQTKVLLQYTIRHKMKLRILSRILNYLRKKHILICDFEFDKNR